jgi:hypothetical protein
MTRASAGAVQEGNGRDARGRFAPGVSGNPRGFSKSKRAAALFVDLANDYGGEASLSAVERMWLGKAVDQLVRSERTRDSNENVRLTNSAKRLLAPLETKRERAAARPEQSLAEYLASKEDA